MYRVLRDDESASDGLVAKKPNAKITVVQHVNGTIASQFISTTADYVSATKFADCAMQYNKRKLLPQTSFTIVRVDMSKLIVDVPRIKIIDLSNRDVLNKWLPPTEATCGIGYARARKYATEYQEVLIKGRIPNDCIEIVAQISSSVGIYLCMGP